MFMSAASARMITNGVNICPSGSITVRFQVHSVETRVYSPGTPRSRQLAVVLTVGSALVGAHKLPLTAATEIGSKLAVAREGGVGVVGEARCAPEHGIFEYVVVIDHRPDDRNLALGVGGREAEEIHGARVEVALVAAAGNVELGQRIVGRRFQEVGLLESLVETVVLKIGLVREQR